MLKVSSLVCFIISVILAAAFIGSRYFGLHIPYLTSLDRQSETTLVIAYSLLLIGIILESVASERTAHGSVRDQTILRTAGTSAGIVAGVFAVLTFWGEQQRSVNVTSLQLLVELEKSRPTNSRFCRCAATELDGRAIKSLRERKTVMLSERARELVAVCFLDLKPDEVERYFSGSSLTESGATAFAGRLNLILGADENIAFAANNGIASREMVVQEMAQSLAVDQIVVARINAELRTNLFPNISKIQVGRHLNVPASDLCGKREE